MVSSISFQQLNHGWNANPNAPYPIVGRSGADLLLQFSLNAFQFPQFNEGDLGILRFHNCARYRLGPTNDEGWHMGQCRYRDSAPAWGEFYELSGDDLRLNEPKDWIEFDSRMNASRHFLFYLKDETFECLASGWTLEPKPTNALCRVPGIAPRG